MSGIARFESYAPPPSAADPTIAQVAGRIDINARELDALRMENRKLRHEKANALAALEAERAESARLRRENQALANQLDTEKW